MSLIIEEANGVTMKSESLSPGEKKSVRDGPPRKAIDVTKTKNGARVGIGDKAIDLA